LPSREEEGGNSGGSQGDDGNGRSVFDDLESGVPGEINGQWYLKYGGDVFPIRTSPEETKDVEIVGVEAGTEAYSGTLYIDSEGDNIVLNEIGSVLGRYFSRIQQACYGGCEENLPEKDCEEGGEDLVVFRAQDQRKVYKEGSCVFIEGDMVAVDAFLYKVFGVN